MHNAMEGDVTIATEPSLNEIGMVIDLAHALIETEDSNTAIEEPISDIEKAAVENARNWLEALSNLSPEDEIAMARDVLKKHGLKVDDGIELLTKVETFGGELVNLVTVSAVHLRPEVADGLNSGKSFGTIIFDKGEHGWFIHTGTDTCDDPILTELLTYASNLGATWLCIDVDGPIVETLTDYSDC